jgi:ABC-type glycerol-3-phosphate transport system substrate-binding protein
MRVSRLKIGLVVMLSMGLMLAGCGGDTADDESTDSAPGDTVGAEIAEDFNKSMDKARDIEEKLQDSKDAIDAAVEEADGAVKD